MAHQQTEHRCISKCEGMTIGTSKSDMKREKRMEKTAQTIQELWGNYNGVTCITEIPKEERG